MIYKFKSPVCADLIMLGPHGDQFLLLIGKVPAAQGILQLAQLPDAIEAVRSAMALDDARLADRAAVPQEATQLGSSADWLAPDDTITLRQRMSPMALMMSTALDAGKDVTWGV